MIEGDMELEEVKTLLKVYEKNTEIDPLYIDDELLRQATIIGRYGEAVATAVRLRDTHASQLSKTIRNMYLVKYNKQPSESYVKSAIEEDTDHIELAYLKTRCDSALDAMKARGHALNKICDLVQCEYFSMPKSPRNYDQEKWRPDHESIKNYTDRQTEELNKQIKPKLKKKNHNL